MRKNNEIISLEVNVDDVNKIISFYEPYKANPPTPYIQFFAKYEDTSFSLYSKEKNGKVKFVIAGSQAKHDTDIWLSMGAQLSEKKPKTPQNSHKVEKKPAKTAKKSNQTAKSSNYIFPQIGSDEVGTGDYFGPVCVCAAYVTEEDYEKLQTLGITDSKLMTDEYIMQVGKTLIASFKYSQLSLDNQKYNELIEKGENLNTIKAKMHNRCLLNLKKKYPNSFFCQDQFVNPQTYYKYLKNEDEIVKSIHFSPKGELAFPSVALASVISRYSFLTKLDKISKKYEMEFPKGAASKVDTFAKKLIKKYGQDVLLETAKINFANTKKILGS